MNLFKNKLTSNSVPIKTNRTAIVGAGVAGMTAAIYLLRSGCDVTVYEKHSISGGVCTGWKRKGYFFEGAVHWLTGSKADVQLYRLWRDTGILADGVKTYREDPFLSITVGGEEIYLYRDLEKQKKHFLAISPEDAKAIERFYRDVKSFLHFQMPVVDIKGVKVKNRSKSKLCTGLKMLPVLIKAARLSRISTEEYAAQFKHEGIKKFLSEFIVRPDYFAVALVATIATLIKDGVFPEGGSLALAKRMENKIIELGGKILFNTEVEKIAVENGVTKGVTVNGKTELYDAVIVAADTVSAQNLFDSPPSDKWIQEIKTKKPMLCTFVGIGVRENLSNLPCSICINEKITVGGVDYGIWGLRNYSKHGEFAPEGCTSLTAMFTDDSYDFWKKHKQNGSYYEQKTQLAAEIARLIEKHLPQLKGKIEVIDIATPLTYERYTASHKGAWMTVKEKSKNYRFLMPEPVCKGIKNVYFAGFRTISPGGLPIALYSGFRAAQYVCRDNCIVFEGQI